MDGRQQQEATDEERQGRRAAGTAKTESGKDGGRQGRRAKRTKSEEDGGMRGRKAAEAESGGATGGGNWWRGMAGNGGDGAARILQTRRPSPASGPFSGCGSNRRPAKPPSEPTMAPLSERGARRPTAARILRPTCALQPGSPPPAPAPMRGGNNFFGGSLIYM